MVINLSWQGKFTKVVFEDNSVTKVVRGIVLEDSEISLKIKAEKTGNVFELGKKFIVKISEVKE